MGWLSVIAVYQLVIHIDINGVILLGLGGVIYSLGVIFFMSLKRSHTTMLFGTYLY